MSIAEAKRPQWRVDLQSVVCTRPARTGSVAIRVNAPNQFVIADPELSPVRDKWWCDFQSRGSAGQEIDHGHAWAVVVADVGLLAVGLNGNGCRSPACGDARR